jgi:hypothetical protein
MPAHTYMRTGNYTGAVTANSQAADVDRKYIAEAHADGVYPAMYFNHNLDFLASAAMMAGPVQREPEAARELTANVTPMLAGMPMLEPFGAKTLFVLLRFAKWNDVLALPQPAEQHKILTAFYHWGRGVAQGRWAPCRRRKGSRRIPRSEARRPQRLDVQPESGANILAVADYVLDARIAAAKGDTAGSIAAWHKAVDAEDQISYNEPPDWFYPTRESLGAALVRASGTTKPTWCSARISSAIRTTDALCGDAGRRFVRRTATCRPRWSYAGAGRTPGTTLTRLQLEDF